MPRTTVVSPDLRTLVQSQDGVATVDQLAECGFSCDAAYRRVRSGRWQRILPRTLLTVSGQPTHRQRLIAASLWAGDESAVDGVDACTWYGLAPTGARTTTVHLVVPADLGTRSHGFVRVRRTLAEIPIGARSSLLRYVAAPTAILVAARDLKSTPAAIGLLSRALQTGLVTTADLYAARESLGDKWCRPLDRALLAVGVGVRSPAEDEAHRLFRSSRVLPPPEVNVWVDLGDGGPPICLDHLWRDAGMGHEVNGREHHAWGTQFDDMQARHGRATAAGLILLHSTPVQLRAGSATVLAQVERAYARYAGRGMPPGVTIINRG